MAKVRKSTGPVEVEALRHADQRVNIPTEELRDFVADDEALPGSVRYPRDPSLDPQLVWKGKDAEDAQDLRVQAVPVYIQEKIHPRVVVENLRRTAAAGEAEPELTLFDDFNGIEFDQLVEFYEHSQNWSNRMILGDSLYVMTSLAEKERLAGKVQMIYLDPPYGIKFGSNWQVSTRKRDVRDGKVSDLTRQPEMIKAFRDTWELGIHSYLSYLRDRLTVARELLTESGSVFVQIGDENVHLVRSVMDEVYGSENFVSLITFKKTSGATAERLAGVADYIVWYARDAAEVKYRPLYQQKAVGGAGVTAYNNLEEADGTRRRMTPAQRSGSEPLRAGARVYATDNLTSQSMGRQKGEGAASWFPISVEDRTFSPTMKARWKTNQAGMQRLLTAHRVVPVGNTLRYVRYLDDFPAYPIVNVWEDTGVAGFADPKTYVVQTNTKVVERCLLMTTDPGDLVLDPTCGSGTTAYVAEQWGRRWITTDTSRVALALARTRLMAARLPAYLLADSPEGRAKEQDLTGQAHPTPSTAGADARDVRKGFVYRRVPHVTLKSIAQNPDIREGMSRAEIDAAIARHADTELLRDQPYEDKRKVRVTGPFTVESLSPHRVLDPGIEQPATETAADLDADAPQFAQTVLDHLRKAGVQNTVKQERLEFLTLDVFPGHWLQAAGEYADADGAIRRVAVSLGPEHGTVGPQQVKEAAKEALRGVGFDVLVVLGFAFDAHSGEAAREFTPEPQAAPTGAVVAEETRQYGKLPVLLARMSPDLLMGDALKATGAGNLFMVFGEPDITITATDDGQPGDADARTQPAGADARTLVVEIHGVDVFDPTTGQVRASSVDDIACWFLDTDYNGESFFVRHAYFTGAEDPYKRLKGALRADIDADAWASLYRTTSRPFLAPSTGRIAVKVINHYGDEVMKVYDA